MIVHSRATQKWNGFAFPTFLELRIEPIGVKSLPSPPDGVQILSTVIDSRNHQSSGASAAQLATDGKAWDRFVQSAPDATIYHLWFWRQAIEDAFGHPGPYLETREGDGAISGVLPLVEMKSRLFGHFFISQPYVNYGGVLGVSNEVEQRLLHEAARRANDAGASFVELRQGKPIASEWPSKEAKVAMVVDLSETDRESYLKSIGSRLRNKIKHAQKHGLRARFGGPELLPHFYPVFAENMRDLGTPVYPRRWFEAVMRHAGDAARLMCIYDHDVCVATTLITRFRNRVELPWIASTAEARKHYSTVLLYWQAIEWAFEQGHASVDFGRCTQGSGTYQFKKQWRPREIPLRWYYALPQGSAIPEIRPSNPKYRLAIWMWKRLPLAIANRIGPAIVRNIP